MQQFGAMSLTALAGATLAVQVGLNATMRDNLTDLEFNLLMLVAPVLRKLAYAEGKVGTLPS